MDPLDHNDDQSQSISLSPNFLVNSEEQPVGCFLSGNIYIGQNFELPEKRW